MVPLVDARARACARWPRRPTCELSGLGTFARACPMDLGHPVVRQTVGLLEPRRRMFGSNVPIEKRWTTCAEVVRVTTGRRAGRSAGDRRAARQDTADRVYRPGS